MATRFRKAIELQTKRRTELSEALAQQCRHENRMRIFWRLFLTALPIGGYLLTQQSSFDTHLEKIISIVHLLANGQSALSNEKILAQLSRQLKNNQQLILSAQKKLPAYLEAQIQQQALQGKNPKVENLSPQDYSPTDPKQMQNLQKFSDNYLQRPDPKQSSEKNYSPKTTNIPSKYLPSPRMLAQNIDAGLYVHFDHVPTSLIQNAKEFPDMQRFLQK